MARIHVTDREGTVYRIDAPEGSILMEVLRDGGMGIEAICGGQCACATCHCFIEPAWFEKVGGPGEDELDLVSCLDSFDASSSRLTCQIEISEAFDGLTLTVAPEE